MRRSCSNRTDRTAVHRQRDGDRRRTDLRRLCVHQQHGAPLVVICPVALGPCIVIMFVCKLIGANIVRLILRAKRGKA